MSDRSQTTVRGEIQDLYFWLGKDAELFGFTPWGTFFLAHAVEYSRSIAVMDIIGTMRSRRRGATD